MTIQFNKQKFALTAKVSELLLAQLEIQTSYTNDDFIRNMFTLRLESFILSALNEKKTLTVYRPRPTFLDWLLRRRRTFTFEFSSKEVLKQPPRLSEGKSVLTYYLEEVKVQES